MIYCRFNVPVYCLAMYLSTALVDKCNAMVSGSISIESQPVELRQTRFQGKFGIFTSKNSPIRGSLFDGDIKGGEFSLSTKPTKGILIIKAETGRFEYYPENNETGEDFFIYKVENDEQSKLIKIPIHIRNTGLKPVGEFVNYTNHPQDGGIVGVYEFSIQTDGFIEYASCNLDGEEFPLKEVEENHWLEKKFVQQNDSHSLTCTAIDFFGNPIPGNTINFSIIENIEYSGNFDDENITVETFKNSKINHKPIAESFKIQLDNENIAIGRLNGIDIDDNAKLEFSIVESSNKGTVEMVNPFNGTFIYTINKEHSNDIMFSDHFDFLISDGYHNSDYYTVTVTACRTAGQTLDTDNDKLNDYNECKFGTSPNLVDTNNDGKSDYLEYTNYLQSLKPENITQPINIYVHSPNISSKIIKNTKAYLKMYYEGIGGKFNLQSSPNNVIKAIIRNIRCAVVVNEDYWEKLIINIYYFKQEKILHLILDGQLAAGFDAPPDSSYEDMEPEYTSSLLEHLNTLLVKIGENIK